MIEQEPRCVLARNNQPTLNDYAKNNGAAPLRVEQ